MERISTFILLAAMISLARTDTLESQYTLGRITGGGIVSNSVLGGPFPSDPFTVVDLIDFQLGKENRNQFFCSLFGGVNFLPGLVMGFPGLNCAFQQGNASRIRFFVETNNTTTIWSKGGLNTTDPKYMGYSFFSLQWDILAHRGEIAVDSEYNDMAFYCGPQVNKGQFGFRSGFHYFIYNWSDGDQGGLYVLPVFGITDNFQICAKINAFPPDTTVEHSPFGLKGDFRLPHCQFSLGGLLSKEAIPLYSSTPYSSKRLSLHTVFAQGTFLSGPHAKSGSNVRGNWDGYFSDLMGRYQAMNTTRVSYYLVPVSALDTVAKSKPVFWKEAGFPIITGCPMWNVKEICRFGILPSVTVGADYGLRASSRTKPEHRLFLSAAASNVRPRAKGPAEVSKYEYTYGYFLKDGEYKISAAWRLPIWGTDTARGYTNTPTALVSRKTPENAGSGYFKQDFFFATREPGIRAVSVNWPFASYDFSLSAGVGIPHTHAMVKNTFTLGRFVRIDPEDLFNYFSYTSTIISDDLSFTISTASDRSALTFGFEGIGQDDRFAKGLDSFYGVAFFNYSRAF